jgi:hypothetical protein
MTGMDWVTLICERSKKTKVTLRTPVRGAGVLNGDYYTVSEPDAAVPMVVVAHDIQLGITESSTPLLRVQKLPALETQLLVWLPLPPSFTGTTPAHTA